MSVTDDTELLLAAFKRFDADGNGKIDRGEFRALLLQLGGAATSADADARFDAMDVDGTGCIDFQEFARWWRARASRA